MREVGAEHLLENRGFLRGLARSLLAGPVAGRRRGAGRLRGRTREAAGRGRPDARLAGVRRARPGPSQRPRRGADAPGASASRHGASGCAPPWTSSRPRRRDLYHRRHLGAAYDARHSQSWRHQHGIRRASWLALCSGLAWALRLGGLRYPRLRVTSPTNSSHALRSG